MQSKEVTLIMFKVQGPFDRHFGISPRFDFTQITQQEISEDQRLC